MCITGALKDLVEFKDRQIQSGKCNTFSLKSLALFLPNHKSLAGNRRERISSSLSCPISKISPFTACEAKSTGNTIYYPDFRWIPGIIPALYSVWSNRLRSDTWRVVSHECEAATWNHPVNNFIKYFWISSSYVSDICSGLYWSRTRIRSGFSTRILTRQVSRIPKLRDRKSVLTRGNTSKHGCGPSFL